ncbi:DUF3986 family protein [Dyadobacter sp. CY347]|uniref:DUF3986 family protein n=1 Tax=Dyadobacter sp. CY347 TaxID=2909336 RepID=UPI0038D3817D
MQNSSTLAQNLHLAYFLNNCWLNLQIAYSRIRINFYQVVFNFNVLNAAERKSLVRIYHFQSVKVVSVRRKQI